MLISGKDFWQLKATHGLPLDFLIEELCFSRGIYPIWSEVIKYAAIDGVNLTHLISSLKQFLQGHPHEKYICAGLEILYEKYYRGTI